MQKSLAIIVFYDKQNKYSFNALIGALETEEYFNDLNIFFVKNAEELKVKIAQELKQYEKIIVAISFATTQLWETDAIVKDIRKNFDNKVFIITGGPHPTGDPIGTLKIGFDLVVRGEGEETFIEFLKKIDKDEDWKTIKGIAFLNERQEYIYTGRRPWINLDKYPPIAVKHEKFGPLEITRGCPYVCSFCQTPYIFGSKLRHRRIENIIKFVEIMKSKKLSDIRFITPNSFAYCASDDKNVDLEKLEELFKAIRDILKKEGKIFVGTFPSEVRPEHVNEDTIGLILKYANNKNLIIGAQSGSQRILDLCHREHKVIDVYNAVQITQRNGITANVDFIFGLPNESREDIRLTAKVMTDLAEMGAKIHAHFFMPLPQTPFAKERVGYINKDLKKVINKLLPKGIIYGDWEKQIEFAWKISKYIKTGEL